MKPLPPRGTRVNHAHRQETLCAAAADLPLPPMGAQRRFQLETVTMVRTGQEHVRLARAMVITIVVTVVDQDPLRLTPKTAVATVVDQDLSRLTSRVVVAVTIVVDQDLLRLTPKTAVAVAEARVVRPALGLTLTTRDRGRPHAPDGSLDRHRLVGAGPTHVHPVVTGHGHDRPRGHGRIHVRDRGLTHVPGRGPTHAHGRDHTRAAAATPLTHARRLHAAAGLVGTRASVAVPLPLAAGDPAKSSARLSLTTLAALSPLSISPTFLATMVK